MDHANQDRDVRSAHRAPEAPKQIPSSEAAVLDLQRTAGNQAVVQLLNVQRHQLDPEHMDEQGGGA